MCAFVYNCATYVSFMHQFTHWLTHTKRTNECVQTNVNGERKRREEKRHSGRPADRQTLLFKMCNIVGNSTNTHEITRIGECHLYQIYQRMKKNKYWSRNCFGRERKLAAEFMARKNHLRCVIHLPKKEQMCVQSCLFVLAHSLTHSRSFADFVRQLLPSMN